MKRKTPALIAVALLAVVAASVAVLATGGSEDAAATLPAPLEESLTSASSGPGAPTVDITDARRVDIDGEAVYLVPAEDGSACIGLADGRNVCGSAEDVARGRLFLIEILDGGSKEDSPGIPRTGATPVTIYGAYEGEADEVIVHAPDGAVLGTGPVIDGVYRATAEINGGTRRLASISLEQAGDVSAVVELD